ncbi:MAG: hypothetical protein IPG94_04980 [Kineosporiaceae bacterium]|nr:hypothetical protein [Kineosporiaceae bacterium]
MSARSPGGGIALLVVLFVAYYCGGYVAGRMARFNGARQGLAVWVWALVIAAVVAVVGVSAGSEFNLLATLNSFPRIPIGEGELSNAGILAAAGVAVTSLVGAVAGDWPECGSTARSTAPASGLSLGDLGARRRSRR